MHGSDWDPWDPDWDHESKRDASANCILFILSVYFDNLTGQLNQHGVNLAKQVVEYFIPQWVS